MSRAFFAKVLIRHAADTGAGVAGVAEHERNRHQHGSHHGSHHGSQGTDSFGNPQAPISNTGKSAYNADGVPVSTTQTGLGLSGNSGIGSGITGSGNRGSDYRDSGHRDSGITGSGITGSGNRDRDNYRDSDNSQGQGRGGVTSYIPGTQAYKDAHRDDSANYGGNQDRDNYNNRGRSDNYSGRDEYGSDRNNRDGRDITAGQLHFH